MVVVEEVVRVGMLRIVVAADMAVADIGTAAGTDIEARSGSEVGYVRNFELDGLETFGFEDKFDTFGFEDAHDTFVVEEDSQR